MAIFSAQRGNAGLHEHYSRALRNPWHGADHLPLFMSAWDKADSRATHLPVAERREALYRKVKSDKDSFFKTELKDYVNAFEHQKWNDDDAYTALKSIITGQIKHDENEARAKSIEKGLAYNFRQRSGVAEVEKLDKKVLSARIVGDRSDKRSSSIHIDSGKRGERKEEKPRSRSESSKRNCRICESRSHGTSDCPKRDTPCPNGGAKGHVSRNCSSPKKASMAILMMKMHVALLGLVPGFSLLTTKHHHRGILD